MSKYRSLSDFTPVAVAPKGMLSKVDYFEMLREYRVVRLEKITFENVPPAGVIFLHLP